ncbi:MAG: hypothetical protein ACD_79C00988G0006 [uncultured bacterium]|nr:MAG: hypothetical protein ACD_79C00988G0006 [uncultured bacterium]
MNERYKKAGLDALISMGGEKKERPKTNIQPTETTEQKEDPGQFFTTRIPKTLIKSLKVLSAQLEKPIQDIVKEAIQEKIETLKHV